MICFAGKQDLLGSFFEVVDTSLAIDTIIEFGLIGYSQNSISCNEIREAPLKN